MPQLDPTWFASQLFWLVVSFALLYLMLSRAMLPRLMEVIATRKATIDSDIERAQRFKTEAEGARQEYEKALAEARGQAQQLIASVMAEHKAAGDRASQETDKQIHAKLLEAQRQIDAKKKELTESLTPTIIELATQIVEKLIQRKPANGQMGSVVEQLSKARKQG